MALSFAELRTKHFWPRAIDPARRVCPPGNAEVHRIQPAPVPFEWSEIEQRYDEIDVAFEPQDGLLWARLRHRERACYTPAVMRDMRDLQTRLRGLAAVPGAQGLRYLVWDSLVDGVHSLGGDLTEFTRVIRAGDRAALERYAHAAIDIIHDNYVSLELPILTAALVRGDALGGGFEAALTNDLIVAETTALFGLPEIVFNLFPGMGAYSFLARKLGDAQAKRMITSGKVYSAAEMHALGIVDVLAEPGTGEAALRSHVDRYRRRHATEVTLRKVGERCLPVSKEELLDVVDMWVERAMATDDADLRRMDRLAAAQVRRAAASPAAALRQAS